MLDVVIAATGNKGKLREIRDILNGVVGSVESITARVKDFAPVEDGENFADNALIKARAGCVLIPDTAIIADDSGLVVNALDGAPGIMSARFGGAGATDEQNYNKLLRLMEGKSDRTAYFVCSIALILPDGRVITAEGRTHGRIINEPRGDKGFGYDPVFFSDELGMCMAESSSQQKNTISHRAKALAMIRKQLELPELL